MIDHKQLLLSFTGRIGRQTFVTAIVGLVAANVVLNLVPAIGSLLALPLLWPLACVTIKRLHDGGRSGWPAVLVSGMCLATGLLSAAVVMLASDPAFALSGLASAGIAILLGGLTTVTALALLSWAALAPGQPGPNRFGVPETMPLRLGDLLSR